MSDYAGKQSRTPSSQAPVQAHAPAPGKQTLVEAEAAVQRHASAGPAAPQGDAAVHAAAARGIATPASAMPFGASIQRAFGRHDISQVQAHTGPEAAASANAMGADAYATGDHVVLGKGNDLFTAAHEAAHVVQQRGGVQLKGGVGAAGDAYEQHADSVASLVVQGKSAEGLLDQSPGGTGASAAAGPVQRSGQGNMAAMNQALGGGGQQALGGGGGQQPQGNQQPQQPPAHHAVVPDVSALPVMNVGVEVASFSGESALGAAIVAAQQQMPAEQGVAALTIAMFHYMHAKAGTLAAVIAHDLGQIPVDEIAQRDQYLRDLSGAMSPKIGGKGLWVGPERADIYLGLTDPADFFREGKGFLLQKAGQVQAQGRALVDLMTNHSTNMDAKSYGRRAESMQLIDVASLPIHGAAAAAPVANTPVACNDARCKYFDDNYAEVAGNALVVGETYSLYFNGTENLEVVVHTNDGTHVVFSSVT